MPFLIKVICYNFKNKKFWSLKYLFNNLVEIFEKKKQSYRKLRLLFSKIIIHNYNELK